MKTIELRNYVLFSTFRNRAGYYQGQEIVDCGLMGACNKYWIALNDGTKKTSLDRLERVQIAE